MIKLQKKDEVITLQDKFARGGKSGFLEQTNPCEIDKNTIAFVPTKKKISVRFFSRSDKKLGYKVIYCKINQLYQRVVFATGVIVLDNNWQNGIIVGNSFDIAHKRKALNMIREELEAFIKLKQGYNINVSLDEIKSEFLTGQLNIVKGITATISEYTRTLERLIDIDICYRTFKKKQGFEKQLRAFIRDKFNSLDIPINEVKTSFVDEFVLYLKCDRKITSYESIKKAVNYLQNTLNYAVSKDYITHNPIATYKVKGSSKIKIYTLTINQVLKLNAVKFETENLEKVKNLFLFQCFTGLAYADLKNLKHRDLYVDEKDKEWIRIFRQKTGSMSLIPLLSEAKFIIGKYSKSTTENIFPVQTNQKYNKALNTIGEKIGVTEFKLTSHVGRKTFASIILNKGTVSIETVSAMLGHSNTKITQRFYAKINQTRIESEMQNFSFMQNNLEKLLLTK